MRGYTLRGSEPPLMLNVTPATQFYKGPKVHCTSDILQKAEDIINPPAPLTLLEKAPEVKGLMTVQGEIVEFAAVRLVTSGKMNVPIRTVQLKEGSCTMSISLWREAILTELAIGQQVTVTHVRCQDSGYGLQLQSTAFTTIQEKKVDKKAAVVIGVMDTEDPNVKQVLLDSDEIVRIAAEMWQPFDMLLEEGNIVVDMEIHGHEIKNIIKK
ncbi:uncharacterized protein LOC107833461 [Poecilia formosa]|uniref:uncharacterized protein LOC107833461 n=1 Tax=Poecilia formosa TaxID=48698 RepID=UPI0007B9FBDF|nr:PREDICTED: uncharacterized protein LOC107833461 [Poecilia formosa]